MRFAAYRPLALVCLLLPQPGVADEPLFGLVSEIRGGVLAHDIAFLGGSEEDGADINAEIIFVAPWDFGREGWLDLLLQPRPHLGVQVNTNEDASQVYAGLTWRVPVLHGAWAGFAAGGAVHDGDLTDGPNRKALGSRVLFRLAAEIGYDVTRNVSLSLYYDHESNAGFAEENEGLNNAGIRIGWRF